MDADDIPAPPPGRDPRTRRWSMTVVREARLLYQGGWTIKEIIDRMERLQGVRPSRTTIRCWVDPGFAEEHRKANTLTQARRRVKEGLPTAVDIEKPPALDADLLLALRLEDGLSYAAIGKIASRFFGTPLTEDQVRLRLHRLGAPKNPLKVRAAERLNDPKAAA